MKWNETIASECRYGHIAGKIFGNADIIWEDSESGWQGHAKILAAMPDNTFALYYWSYGSCSFCDSWERAEFTGEQIQEEMRKDTSYMDLNALKKYYKIDDKNYSFVKKEESWHERDEEVFDDFRNAVIKYIGTEMYPEEEIGEKMIKKKLQKKNK
jgi:hypothetical protein